MTNTTNYRARIYENYASNFQDAPETFDETAAWQWGRAQRYYLRQWLPTDKNAHIVDLACGGGKLLYFFKRMGYTNITGVDISPEQVKLAKQVTPDVEEANVLVWLEAHPASFDLISGFDIVEHFHKDEVLRFSMPAMAPSSQVAGWYCKRLMHVVHGERYIVIMILPMRWVLIPMLCPGY